jgi:Spy/CpxP family protein refolding chaperone
MRNVLLTAAVLAAATWALPSYGQSSSTQPVLGQSPTTKPALPSGYVIVAGWYGTYEDLFKVCEPTAEQQKRILDIEARKAKVVADNQAAVKTAADAMSKVRLDQGSDAVNKAVAQYQAANKPVNEAQTKAQAELAAVLTKEQKAKWQEYLVLKSVKQWQQGVTFTDEQWDKIVEIYEKLAKEPALPYWPILQRLNAKINDILTPQQKAKKLLTTKYAVMNQSVHLTDEQVKKLVKIEDERARETSHLQETNAPRLAELNKAWWDTNNSGDQEAIAAMQAEYAANNQLYTDLYKKYDDQVQAILTDQQKTAWQEVQKKNPYWQWNVQPGGGGAASGQLVPVTPRK